MDENVVDNTVSLNAMNAPSMSVVVITHERPDFLKIALQSVLSQTMRPFEIIVVNDCSQKDYQPVLNEFLHSNIKYECLKQKSGANVARNRGVVLSTGDVVCFLDDDDIWLNHFLEEHLNAYLTAPDASAVICGHRIMESQDEININPSPYVTAQELRYGNRFSGMSGFSAKRILLNEILFDPNLKNGQDWDLYVRIVQRDVRFVNLPSALFLYRKGTPGGITAEVKKMHISSVETRLLSADKHRAWLGERQYKRRVSEQVLSFLPNKSHKYLWIKKSLELAGFYATANTLIRKIVHRIKQH